MHDESAKIKAIRKKIEFEIFSFFIKKNNFFSFKNLFFLVNELSIIRSLGWCSKNYNFFFVKKFFF